MKKFGLAFILISALVTTGCDYCSSWFKKNLNTSCADKKTTCCGDHSDNSSTSSDNKTEEKELAGDEVVAG